MNLLVLRPFIAPWEVEVYDELNGKDIDVSFILTYFPTSGYEKIILRKTLGRSRSYNVSYSGISMAISSNPFLKRILWFRLVWPDTDIITCDLKNVLRRLSPSVIDTLENYTLTSLIATTLKSRIGAKMLVTSWENIVMPFHRFSLRHLVNRGAECFRAMSESAKARLVQEKVGKGRIVVIPPAINTERFSPEGPNVREKLGLQGKKVVLFVGRFLRQKGIVELVLSMRNVKKRVDDVALLMIGDGPLKPVVENLAKKTGLEDMVYLHGPVNYEKLPLFYRSSDLLVLPSLTTKSWREQFGYVLIEAMASGIPVVASKSGAIPEVVKEGNTGLLVEPGSIADLSEKIVQLLESDSLRKKMGRTGRLHVEANYSLKSTVPRLKELYLSLGAR
ncbi:MAG: glycosyltransferase family 4 protein [Candidatus Bathyarchaeia archaeon]|uniref:glycosyltransferase family 4 protein n=1 Tax=Thermofilum sp. TaxID=1961369 RepID=UPI003163BB1F